MPPLTSTQNPISPIFNISIAGISPGYLTMNAISLAGSPPIGKNSEFEIRIILDKLFEDWVSYNSNFMSIFLKSFPILRKDWISPRVPMIITTILNDGGDSSEEFDKSG